jgi:enoyl-CoA hydratase
MHDKGLILLTVDQQIAVVTLNNPPANVLSRAVIEQLSQTFHDLERMDLAAIILTGQDDRFFSAGADIKELAENTVEQNRSYFSRVYETFSLIADCRFPVIAAVNGYAVGAGLELALCADIRVMDENAQLAATGVNLNLVFCTQRLVRLVGPGRAKDMLLYPAGLMPLKPVNLGWSSILPRLAWLAAKPVTLPC